MGPTLIGPLREDYTQIQANLSKLTDHETNFKWFISGGLYIYTVKAL